METIEDKTDSDIGEVVASKAAFGIVEDATKAISALFSVLTAERMMGVLDGAPKKAPLPPTPRFVRRVPRNPPRRKPRVTQVSRSWRSCRSRAST
jgi:hypothetical protein